MEVVVLDEGNDDVSIRRNKIIEHGLPEHYYKCKRLLPMPFEGITHGFRTFTSPRLDSRDSPQT